MFGRRDELLDAASTIARMSILAQFYSFALCDTITLHLDMESQNNLFSHLCPCGCFDSFDDQLVDFIKEFQYWFLILNHEQGFLGRTILILKEHKTDERQLSDEEAMENHSIYCQWRDAMDKSFGPDKINQAQLGNEEHIHKGHLHWHFIPRYRRPVTFAEVAFQYDTMETQKLNYTAVRDKTIHPIALRTQIRDELRKHF